ncbi:hypothetical protein SynMITS9220_00727 [Synechococcus sp. MIT S9220]|nr:hypothetical protein SynMITS9220_00727 [Synechococcus sp. MIT S9220]
MKPEAHFTSESASAFGSTQFHRGDPFEIAAIKPRLKSETTMLQTIP